MKATEQRARLAHVLVPIAIGCDFDPEQPFLQQRLGSPSDNAGHGCRAEMRIGETPHGLRLLLCFEATTLEHAAIGELQAKHGAAGSRRCERTDGDCFIERARLLANQRF